MVSKNLSNQVGFIVAKYIVRPHLLYYEQEGRNRNFHIMGSDNIKYIDGKLMEHIFIKNYLKNTTHKMKKMKKQDYKTYSWKIERKLQSYCYDVTVFGIISGEFLIEYDYMIDHEGHEHSLEEKKINKWINQYKNDVSTYFGNFFERKDNSMWDFYWFVMETYRPNLLFKCDHNFYFYDYDDFCENLIEFYKDNINVDTDEQYSRFKIGFFESCPNDEAREFDKKTYQLF